MIYSNFILFISIILLSIPAFKYIIKYVVPHLINLAKVLLNSYLYLITNNEDQYTNLNIFFITIVSLFLVSYQYKENIAKMFNNIIVFFIELLKKNPEYAKFIIKYSNDDPNHKFGESEDDIDIIVNFIVTIRYYLMIGFILSLPLISHYIRSIILKSKTLSDHLLGLGLELAS